MIPPPDAICTICRHPFHMPDRYASGFRPSDKLSDMHIAAYHRGIDEKDLLAIGLPPEQAKHYAFWAAWDRLNA
jgi:hypothetical protein